MPKYHYYSLYQEFKVPIEDDGTLGSPIVTKQFAKTLNKSDGDNQLKKKKPKMQTDTKVSGVEEL